MASFKEINIPQKPPMVMVDRIVEINDMTTVTAFLIRADNVFVDNGLFREPGLIENIAQSAAAGMEARSGEAGEARFGDGAIAGMGSADLPRCGGSDRSGGV